MKQKAKFRLLFSKSFVGLLVVLLVISGLAYGIFRDQFTTEDSAPPSLASETSLLQGLIKTGIYLKFDDSDFDRTARLPRATTQSRGLSYFYAERDMTMLEIANSIKPDKDLRIIIAHFGKNLDVKDNEKAKMFYTFPHGVYKDTKKIDQKNDYRYVVKAYDGFIIAGSKDFGTWNLKHLSDMPARSFQSFDRYDRGWLLFSTNNISKSIQSCSNRISTVWKYEKSAKSDFEEIDLDQASFNNDSYMAWAFLIGSAGTCFDEDEENEDVVCEDEELKDRKKLICMNEIWVPCDRSTVGSSIFNKEYVCTDDGWSKMIPFQISINTIIPSTEVPYEKDRYILVAFNENELTATNKILETSIRLNVSGRMQNYTNEVVFTNDGFLQIKYNQLQPVSEYKVTIPAGSLLRNGVLFNDDLSSTFNTSATMTSTSLEDLLCISGGNTYSHGEGFINDCNSCVCSYGSVACTKKYCGSETITCSPTGFINEKDTSLVCFNMEYIECSEKLKDVREIDGSYTLSNFILFNLTGLVLRCDPVENEWSLVEDREVSEAVANGGSVGSLVEDRVRDIPADSVGSAVNTDTDIEDLTDAGTTGAGDEVGAGDDETGSFLISDSNLVGEAIKTFDTTELRELLEIVKESDIIKVDLSKFETVQIKESLNESIRDELLFDLLGGDINVVDRLTRENLLVVDRNLATITKEDLIASLSKSDLEKLSGLNVLNVEVVKNAYREYSISELAQKLTTIQEFLKDTPSSLTTTNVNEFADLVSNLGLILDQLDTTKMGLLNLEEIEFINQAYDFYLTVYNFVK